MAVADASLSHAVCAWQALFRVPLLHFGHEIRWCFAVAHVPQSHALCDWRVCWPQDVANMRNKLKSLSFSRVSEGTLGPFLGFLCNVLPFFWGPLLRFGHEISFFFAVVIGGFVGRKMWQTGRASSWGRRQGGSP